MKLLVMMLIGTLFGLLILPLVCLPVTLIIGILGGWSALKALLEVYMVIGLILGVCSYFKAKKLNEV